MENKKIIVTGASSGIGEKLVWHIAENGGIPIMIARSIDKLEAQQIILEKKLQVESFVYQADLQEETELEIVFKKILEEHTQLHGLINNAGVGFFDYIKDMDWQEVNQMYQLNVFAVMRTTKIMMAHFSQYNEGHIINIASQAGKIATPRSSVYASTKHAVLGFTNGLRLENTSTNIQVTTVNLGPVRTNFFTLADPEGSYQKNVNRYMLDPDRVAKKITAVLFTNKREVNLPSWMEFGSKLYHLFPSLMETILKKQFNKK
ncbi:SDR family oxidoreductase [Virgibacillus tibetensis]